MEKRPRTATEDYESLANKIKKLDEKLKRTRHRHEERTPRSSGRGSSSSSDTSRSPPQPRSTSRSQSPRAQPETQSVECVAIPSTSTSSSASGRVTADQTPHNNPPPPSTNTGAVTELHLISVASQSSTTTTSVGIDIPLSPSDSTWTLDHDLLVILGEDPSQAKAYSAPIQPDLAVRLNYIASKGLANEVRKELMDKYLPPENATIIEAPTLNPEVIAGVSEAVLKRDKVIKLRQKQLTSAISCVAGALTLLMSTEPKNTAVIQILMDAIKLMCDSQNSESKIRRSFILNSLKKDLKDQLQATKIDKFLFSESLADILKAAKAISQSGADMKQTPTKPIIMKNKPPHSHTNWRTSPQNYQPKGTQRTRDPPSHPAQNRNRR